MTGRDQGSAGDAVAGLARELEALHRTVEGLAGLRGRVEEIAELVARLCETTAATSTHGAGGGGEAEPPTSWLTMRGNTDAAGLLAALTRWLRHIYLRYADALAGLPECWAWHPEIVEELTWLMQAWDRAYDDERGSVQAAADWHDRLRPAVVRRVSEYAKNCSLDKHLHHDNTDRGRDDDLVPLVEARDLIAAWWESPSGPPPAPTPTLLAAADARHRRRGGRA